MGLEESDEYVNSRLASPAGLASYVTCQVAEDGVKPDREVAKTASYHSPKVTVFSLCERVNSRGNKITI
ncbi:hypothetical protein E2C01_059496 [Portunus trituberculatus]|uniref:Uncharacterized protein n=1 Tax=Portunus trituberculatus TaxID=210409 RepID=A0A5B7H2Q4_PORTR|nr:hypothetical protein [Portunus trituberculatus]